MRSLQASALILDLFDLQERDRIVTFLTSEWGKKRGVARGARAKYSRFAGQLQPLARVHVQWFEKDNRDLVRISEVALERPAVKLQESLEGILASAYLAEHMVHFAVENEASEHLFRLLDTTIVALLAGADLNLATRYYEVWVLRLSGIFPVPWECPLCGQPLETRARLLDGALICNDCAQDAMSDQDAELEVGAEELEFLRRSGRENLQKLSARPPSPRTLRRIERLSARVRREFLQDELKSYRVMQQTLAQV